MAEPEVAGQAEMQPWMSEQQLAHAAALRIITSEEAAPKEEAKEEAPEPEKEAAAEEAKAEEAPAEEKEPTKEEKAEIRRLKLKYNGEEKEVEEPEAIELAQKGYDYTQKTMALAKERDEWRQKSQAELTQKQKEYDDKLALAEQAIWQTLMPEIQSIDWNKLAQENPSEWAQKYQYVQNVNARLAQIQGERKVIAEQNQGQQREAMQKAAKEAVEILQKEIPGWSNDKYGQILKSGVEQYGFKQEELNAITDPRAIKVLHDAMQFRALQNAKPIVEKKVKDVPKVARPGTAEKPDPSAEQWKNGMTRLQQSGGKDMNAALSIARKFVG